MNANQNAIDVTSDLVAGWFGETVNATQNAIDEHPDFAEIHLV
jgi:hypothetical protein